MTVSRITMVSLFFASFVSVAQNRDTIEVGSLVIDSQKIQPYNSTWQYVRIEGSEKIQLGKFNEELSIVSLDNEDLIQRKKSRAYNQDIRSMKEGVYKETLILNGLTLAPIYRMEFDPDSLVQTQIFRDQYYWFLGKRADEPRLIELPSNAFNLASMALVLQSLPLEDNYQVVFPAGGYWVEAFVVGTTSIELRELWKIETTWINRRNPNSVFPGGDDGSGGSFYLFKSTQEGESAMYKNVWTDEKGLQMIVMDEISN